jgi:hypothetical protein
MDMSTRHFATLTVCAIAVAGTVANAQATTQASPRREIVGDLGITAVECDCTFDGRNSRARVFKFRSNLIVIGVAPSGPSAGLIFPGDTIFDIDGTPLMTREGGIGLANVRPGQRVTLGLRRAGRAMRIGVTAGSIDADAPDALGRYTPGVPRTLNGYYEYPWTPQPVAPSTPTAPTPATPVPRASTPPPVWPEFPAAPRSPRSAPSPWIPPAPSIPAGAGFPDVPPSPASPDGWFGFSLRCSECGWERVGTESTPRWESSIAPEIGIVAPGSPADRAGLKTGDRITHINGVSILAPEGSRRFGAVRPGQRIRLTVLRNGTPITRELMLEERPRPSYDRRSLRYTGRLSGVAVEVWSAAGATVQREGDTMVINVGGSTVRLKATTPAPSR